MIEVPIRACGCRPGAPCAEQSEHILRKDRAWSEVMHCEAELESRDLKEYGRVQLQQRLAHAQEEHRQAVEAVKAHRLENTPDEKAPARGERTGAQEGTEAEHRPSCPESLNLTSPPFRLHSAGS